eukprot:9800215-Alexandrium_andersonii.AAC.1
MLIISLPGGLRPPGTPLRSVSGAPARRFVGRFGTCANYSAGCAPQELWGSMLRPRSPAQFKLRTPQAVSHSLESDYSTVT